MIALHFALGLAATLLVAGCGIGPAPATGAGQASPPAPLVPPSAATLHAPQAPQPTAAVVLPKAPEPGPPLAPKGYEVKGRPDPFVAISVPKPKDLRGPMDVNSFKLAGVIRGPNLLALLEAPDGVGYIMKPGEMLGNARVTEISASSVTFAVDALGSQRPNSVTLRLKTD
jgi:hypothetical protein